MKPHAGSRRLAHRPDRTDKQKALGACSARSADQCRRRLGLGQSGSRANRAMRAGGEMDNDIDAGESGPPIGLWANIADRSQLYARDRFDARACHAHNPVAKLHQSAAQRTADKTGGPGH